MLRPLTCTRVVAAATPHFTLPELTCHTHIMIQYNNKLIDTLTTTDTVCKTHVKSTTSADDCLALNERCLCLFLGPVPGTALERLFAPLCLDTSASGSPDKSTKLSDVAVVSGVGKLAFLLIVSSTSPLSMLAAPCFAAP